MGRDPLSDTHDELPSPLMRRLAAVRVDLAARTDRGKVRPHNEDNFHVVRFGRYLRTLLSSLPPDAVAQDVDEDGYAIAVADGMGGRNAGEVASRLALVLVVQHALETPDWILGTDDPHVASIVERAVERFACVNQGVLDQSQNEPRLAGMATTLTVALSLRDDLFVSHVGDSPAFLCRAGKLHRLTRDHTLGAELTGAGIAHAGRLRHVLTKAIGTKQEGAAPDVQRFRLADGDRLLLCTDGLTDMVDVETIARQLSADVPADVSCQALLDLALARGAKDNVTVAVARYRIAREQAP